MTIQLAKCLHSPELGRLIQSSWDTETLLILCPPLLNDFSFRRALPAGQLEFFGEWSEEQKSAIKKIPSGNDWPLTPILGVFTSGTTSISPRLVLYSKENIESSVTAIFSLFRGLKLRKLFCFPQAFHTFGLNLGYVACHLWGLDLVIPPAKYGTASQDMWLELSGSEWLTLGTPTHFYDLMKRSQARGLRPRPTLSAIVGGSMVSRQLWQDLQSQLGIVAPSIGYGCSEASPGITHLAPGLAPQEEGDIGYPLPSIHAKLRSEIGVEIEGPSLARVIVQNGKSRLCYQELIRDRIRVNSAGRWIFQGRTDLVLNRGANKYSLQQIELQIGRELGISVVAVAVKDDRLGQDLALAFPVGSGRKIWEQVAHVIRETFDFALRLENCQDLQDWPLNESAKVDRIRMTQLLEDAKWTSQNCQSL